MHHAYTILNVDTGDFAVRAVLLRGTRFCLFWDTLPHPRDLASASTACTGVHPLVVYSHADWDHIWGTAALETPVVIGHSECAARFLGEAQQTLAEFQAREPEAWADIVLIPPTITFDYQMTVHLGNMTLHLHHLPGHTPDSIVGFIPELGLLLAGDTVEAPCPCVPQGCDIAEWIARLQFWRDHAGLQVVIPAHGAMGDATILDQTITYLKNLQRGRPMAMPTDMTPFYARTHQENLRHCGHPVTS